MMFMNRLFGSVSKAARPRPEDRSPRRRRAQQFSLESLEERDLKSTTPIPGVSLSYGGLSINATQGGGNVATVESSGGNTIVTLNGQTVVYDDSDGPIWTVNYSADQHAQGGHDTFINNTNLTSTVAMYGGYNFVQGGTNWDSITVTEGNNTVITNGGGGIVRSYGGSGNDFSGASDASIYSSDFNPYYYSRFYYY
jgi:hypothetical protein